MDTVTKPNLRMSSSALAGKTDRLLADFQTFVGDVEQLLKSAAQLPGDGLAMARGRLEEKVSQAKSKLADVGATAANAAYQARDRSEDYIRDRPWTAIGVAIAAGAVVGVLLSRRW
jgi:ElaB/YqjD/DUF883 family membrane-anchored ribosome-binding protein